MCSIFYVSSFSVTLGKKDIDYEDSQENGQEDVTRASYMGVCKLPNQAKAIHRRIDIKIYPHELLPFAMLYFTGSDHFNRSMRLYAKKRGFSLSDKVRIFFFFFLSSPINYSIQSS
jgi:hypothetical protein